MIEFSSPSIASAREIAPSTSSAGLASPDLTRSACAVASMPARSSAIAETVSGALEEMLETDDERLVEVGDAPHREEHPRHEAGAIERVVADGERLSLAPEDDLLVSDETRQADRVDRLADA